MCRYADIKKMREKECEEEGEDEGREMREREREFGTFSLLFLNDNILFRTL